MQDVARWDEEFSNDINKEALTILRKIHGLSISAFPGFVKAGYRVVPLPDRSPETFVIIRCVRWWWLGDDVPCDLKWHPLFVHQELGETFRTFLFRVNYDGQMAQPMPWQEGIK